MRRSVVVLGLAAAMLAGLAVDQASALTLVYTNAVLRNPSHPQWGGGGGGGRGTPFPGPGASDLLGLELFTDADVIGEHIDIDKFFLGLEWHHMTWVRDPGDPDIITLSEGIENLTGLEWHGYRVQLGGGAFFVPDQYPDINPVPVDAVLNPELTDILLVFDPPIPSGNAMYNLTIGILNGVPDQEDVQIDISQVPEGGFFTIRQYPIIPEPATLLLLGVPLGAAIWRRRRR